jgi:hypothetical protein
MSIIGLALRISVSQTEVMVTLKFLEVGTLEGKGM